MIRALVTVATLSCAAAFAPFSVQGLTRTSTRYNAADNFVMKLEEGQKVVLIGVAADSGCGKSTFMRRLTKVFGGAQVGPLGGGFPESWETNTLVSDQATVLCLDDYHANDRAGRKVSGLTALNEKEQNFDLMYEQLKALKEGKSIAKPIYNHVNGTLDAPETVEPTPIVIVEGLHPMVDERVRKLLDFTIYLDISDDIKFAWKIQRDMAERGWTLEQVKESIDARKPDFAAFVAPQMEYSDVVISVLPSEISKEEVGKHLKVKMIQRTGMKGFKPAYVLDPASKVIVEPTEVKTEETCGVQLAYMPETYFGRKVQTVVLDGKLTDINDYAKIEKLLADTGAKSAGELTAELVKVGPNSPGSMDGTGLFQTVTALKLREFYEASTA
mmetsp:Transcript_12173/g.12252  ORF Transcript_12173/g.12252 Transcript_12173/m.12252 type:complete len:386 (-) Transcript_12173:200-1357(-)